MTEVDGRTPDVRERHRFRPRVDDLRYLHQVDAYEALHRKNSGEMIRRVFEKEKPRLRVCGQIGL